MSEVAKVGSETASEVMGRLLSTRLCPFCGWPKPGQAIPVPMHLEIVFPCSCNEKLDEFAMEAFRAFLRSESPINDEDAAVAAYDLAEAMVRERAKRRG